MTTTPSPRDDDNNNLDKEDQHPTSNYDDVDDNDDDADADDEDSGTDQGTKDVKHAVAPVCWINVSQDWHKWKSLEEDFVRRS